MANIALKWTGEDSRLFIGRDSLGHVVLTGSWASETPEWQEWRATKPSDLLLISLAACSGHDVVMILERQRQTITGLSISVEGKQMADPPYAFTDIHLHYLVEGANLDDSKVRRAINLSEEKYCSVAATVRGVANITHSYELV